MTIYVTEKNINVVRDLIPADQAKFLKVGCVAWRVFLEDGSMCFMAVWPDSWRGAVSWGSEESLWGDWDDETDLLSLDHSGVVNEFGEWV